MSELPQDYRYTETHQWARKETDGSVRIGITDFAQAELGDLVYVELPAVGKVLEAGKPCAVVESVKAASDVYTPVAGTVVGVNETLTIEPELINRDAWSAWLFSIAPSDSTEFEKLLDANTYYNIYYKE
ncbi:glycine cleavage system protein GcvH [Candidatus Methylospira mobilis]|uniref:Glycine cleavage system H protein n=1 Tax=Candidatus Methylospira mobilis TaxID=1808979 RepID=A0A5Q0BR41_9GAMM|nr:glycine cleavage system protein GcvH [Candidatus Methylospira mobilis]QFY44664.1 glycine cleavage system protein GcvH [Candidatus Methylospira mobilis]WNV05799.1 glycine cleavage system protein GcvH [Candidatus Methylospira mobilis]